MSSTRRDFLAAAAAAGFAGAARAQHEPVAFALIGDRYHNSDHYRTAFGKTFVRDMGLAMDLSDEVKLLNADHLSRYRVLIILRDGMIWPDGHGNPRIELFIPPKKGISHVLRLIRELLSFQPRQSQTDIAGALDYFGRVIRRRCVAFVLSDFQGEGYEQPLRILGKRHDLIAVSVTDPREVHMPSVGLVELEDAETGEVVLIDTGSMAVRRGYEQMGHDRAQALRDGFRAIGIDHISIVTGRDVVRDLVVFFRGRERASVR